MHFFEQRPKNESVFKRLKVKYTVQYTAHDAVAHILRFNPTGFLLLHRSHINVTQDTGSGFQYQTTYNTDAYTFHLTKD